MSDLYYNATSISIDGIAILIEGKPKSGKSSLALSLIEEGGRLISEDITFLTLQNQRLYAKPAEKLSGALFIREIGMISVPYEKGLTEIKAVIHIGENGDISLNQKTILISGIEIPFFEFISYDFALTNKIKAVIKLLKKEWNFIEP